MTDDRKKSRFEDDPPKDQGAKKEEKAEKAPDASVIERERDTLPLEGE